MKTALLIALASAAVQAQQPTAAPVTSMILLDDRAPSVVFPLISSAGIPFKIHALTCNVPWPQSLRINEARFYLAPGSSPIFNAPTPWVVAAPLPSVNRPTGVTIQIESLGVPTTCFLTWSY